MGGDVQRVVELLRGGRVAMILRAGCRLAVFDHLEEPRTVAELTGAVGADPGAMARFVRILVDLGLVERREDRYVASAVGAALRTDHPSHLRDLVLVQTDLPTVAAWHDLEGAVRTGAGVYEAVNGRSHWEHLNADPDAEERFNAAMARRGPAQVAILLESVELGGASTVVDVGGGRGAMLAGLLAELPALNGVVAERPAVAEEATAFLTACGYGDRGRGIACDFFSSVPAGADAYTMCHVLHDWGDQECVQILRTVRAAMPATARLWVVERVIDAPGRPAELEHDLHLLDLHMLVMFGARERTHAEYDGLFAAAGFSPSRLAGAGDWNVLEAWPAS